jgi:hypothetical protein
MPVGDEGFLTLTATQMVSHFNYHCFEPPRELTRPFERRGVGRRFGTKSPARRYKLGLFASKNP